MAALVLVPVALVCPVVCALFVALLRWDNVKPYKVALLLALCCAVAVHGMRWEGDHDIVRAMQYLQNYIGIGFLQCFDAGHYTSLYVWDIWNWVVGLFHDPYLLQTSAAFIGYAIIFYIVLDHSRILNFNKGQVIAAVLFAFSAIPMLSVFDGIRSTCACLICAWAFYRHQFHGSRWIATVACMVSACLIHQVALIPLLLFVFFPIMKKAPFVSAFVTAFAVLMLILFASAYAGAFSSSSNPAASFLGGALDSFSVYTLGSGDQWSIQHARTFTSRAGTLLNFILVAFLVYVAGRNIRKMNDSPERGYNLYLLLILFVSVVLMLALTVNGGRLLPIAFVCGAPLAVHCIVQKEDNCRCGLSAGMTLLCIAQFVLHGYSLIYKVANPLGMVLPPLFMGLLSGLV